MNNLFEFVDEGKELTKQLHKVCKSFDDVKYWSSNEVMNLLGIDSFYKSSEILFNAMARCVKEKKKCDEHFNTSLFDVYISGYGLYQILENYHGANSSIKEAREEFGNLSRYSHPLPNSLISSDLHQRETAHRDAAGLWQTKYVDSEKLKRTVRNNRLYINGIECWSVSKLLEELCVPSIAQAREIISKALSKCKSDVHFENHLRPFLFDIFTDQYGLFLLLESICKNVEVVSHLYDIGITRYPNNILPQIQIESNNYFLFPGDKIILPEGIKERQNQFKGMTFTVRSHNYSHDVAIVLGNVETVSRFDVKLVHRN